MFWDFQTSKLYFLPALEQRNFKRGGYLPEVPMDPWGREYLYLSPGEYGEVDIYSLGADGLPGGEDQSADIGNWGEGDDA